MKYLLTVLALVISNVVFPQAECPNAYDGNGDGAVTISDLLDLLGLFGDADADQDGIWDSVDACVDTGSCNYAANPTEPCAYIDVLGICGGGCDGDGDGDGICDDVDTCVGQLDECGVCNGPGPTEIVIDAITILYDSVYLPQLEEWYVYEFGADTSFSYTCAPYFGDCGDPVSYHGYDYATVLIGEQCWFAESLRSTSYSDGTEISGSWGSGLGAVLGGPAYEDYGLHYNGHAVMDERNICPIGWKVPSDLDFFDLELQIGMSESEVQSGSFWRGETEGAELKSQNWNGTDNHGFNMLPAGYIETSGSWNEGGSSQSVHTWTTSGPEGSDFLYHRAWNTEESRIGRGDYSRNYGFTVRCLRDVE